MKTPTPKSPAETALVFALDKSTAWEDLENAMAACVNYQSAKRGKILPLMFFAPMTEPDNLDAWEPMKQVPENLLVVSIERKVDRTILQALQQAEDVLGEIRHAASFPSVSLNYGLPLAEVYRQMADAEILAYTFTQTHQDDPSFFFLRGLAAVKAFDRELRNVTR
jgi:hypothetical protein